MIPNRSRKTIWQGLEWKIVVATVAIVAFFGVLIARKMKEPAPGGVGIDEKAIQQPKTSRRSGKLPASNHAKPVSPLYPMDDWSNYPAYAGSEMSGRTETMQIPGGPSAITKTEVDPLSSSQTQVHSLDQAWEVMGMPSDGVDAVGLTRTYQLPGQPTGSSTSKVSGNPIVIPPMGQPDEAGQTKTYPLPNDPTQP
jgi:hypothetical protein